MTERPQDTRFLFSSDSTEARNIPAEERQKRIAELREAGLNAAAQALERPAKSRRFPA